ncbi:unnamed protein product [Coffea canephora]|uniref:Uncharacterized protein n=1 Tax=Coffea canephora TaxID=49390 RepID=A0A068TVS8_COFCA|nr:unnamed protein product [Coffea canephora]
MGYERRQEFTSVSYFSLQILKYILELTVYVPYSTVISQRLKGKDIN